MSTVDDAHAVVTPADSNGAGRPAPAITPLIRWLAAFNVLTVILSVIGFATNLGLLSLLFPQAAVFFPRAWDDYLGRAGIWFFVMGIAALTALIGALRAPRGHRGVGAFRAVTVCGAIVALISPLIVGVLSLL